MIEIDRKEFLKLLKDNRDGVNNMVVVDSVETLSDSMWSINGQIQLMLCRNEGCDDSYYKRTRN